MQSPGDWLVGCHIFWQFGNLLNKTSLKSVYDPRKRKRSRIRRRCSNELDVIWLNIKFLFSRGVSSTKLTLVINWRYSTSNQTVRVL